MTKEPWKIEINADTPREDLERYIIEATLTSDHHVQNLAARAQAEIWRRDTEKQHELFHAESRKRVKAQNFQEAQFSKQLDVAKQQANSAQRAMIAAWAAAAAAAEAAVAVVVQLFK